MQSQTNETNQSSIEDSTQNNVAGNVKKRRSVLFVLIALIIGGLIFYCIYPNQYESTDNAYIDSDNVVIAPKVHGFIQSVYVQDNQFVKKGDPLVQIDAEEFNAKVAFAKADLSNALAQVQSVKSELMTLASEETYSISHVKAAESSIISAKESASTALASKKRYDRLLNSGSVSKQDAEKINDAAVSAEQTLNRAIAEFDVAKSAFEVTKSKRKTLHSKLLQMNANVVKAKANLDLAIQNQNYSVIHAPIDGLVGNHKVQVGDYIQTGRQLMTLVPEHQRFIIANFKETQISKIQIGQSVDIKIDALPKHSFKGRVQSLSPASSSVFALLPFEPGTGNFTKIVQRVPVKIAFENHQTGLNLLKPGLSAEVTVSVKNHRKAS